MDFFVTCDQICLILLPLIVSIFPNATCTKSFWRFFFLSKKKVLHKFEFCILYLYQSSKYQLILNIYLIIVISSQCHCATSQCDLRQFVHGKICVMAFKISHIHRIDKDCWSHQNTLKNRFWSHISGRHRLATESTQECSKFAPKPKMCHYDFITNSDFHRIHCMKLKMFINNKM